MMDLSELIVKTSYAMAHYISILVASNVREERREEFMDECIELWDKTFHAYIGGENAKAEHNGKSGKDR